MKDELGKYCDPDDTEYRYKDECNVEEDLLVPPNAALREK